MATKQVTYDDKSVSKESSVVATKKVSADDMNELKEVINNNADELDDSISDIYSVLGLEKSTYDSSETYAVDDLVIYSNAIYKCNTDSTTGDWDSQYWDLVPIIEEVEE